MNMYQVNYGDDNGDAGFQLIEAYDEESARQLFYEHYLEWVEITSVDDCGSSLQYTLSGVIDSKGFLICY